ncbi:hypothetical protein [Nannocystis pusilla]|uniref:hypothetical protein n=1 Tax=Nannocystis pusilla TaxID=889268 RepID=UPI003B7FFD75
MRPAAATSCATAATAPPLGPQHPPRRRPADRRRAPPDRRPHQRRHRRLRRPQGRPQGRRRLDRPPPRRPARARRADPHRHDRHLQDRRRADRTGTSDSPQAPAFERVGLAAALGGVAQAFFDRFYALPKERGALAIAGVIGAAAGGALVSTLASNLAPPLQRFIPDEMRSYATDFFRPTRARVEVDGRELPFASFASMQVGAIDINLAGVVRCFRHAREGGVLHFQALDTTPIGVVANVPNIVLGTPILGRKVYDDKARRVRITAEDGEALNPVIDGEQFHGLGHVELTLGPRVELPTFASN